ncbi:MAG: divalent metal cation transporter, partial [Acidobacteriia bacterium]|nr:divalent metal cation transporter [Terriglobia bacterium]
MALMTAQQVRDPYALTSADVENPPRSLATLVRKLGPGIILAGSIVGSGELIATTVLGAENGYTLLWLVVVSCVIKNIIQNELGRYAIGTGETTLEAFDRVPGPRLGVSWVVWLWVLMIAGTVLTIGAMLGAIGEVLNMLAPAVPINVWTWLIAAVSVMILLVGEYGMIEKISVVLVSYFTLMTVLAGAMLVTQPEYFSWGRVLEGFTFQRPSGGLLTAVAAFGITGAGSVELFMYPYWGIEKGYARVAGPRDASTLWRERARGWSRV